MFTEAAAELYAGGFGIIPEHAGAGVDADNVGFWDAELKRGARDEACAGGDIEQLHSGREARFAQGGTAVIPIASKRHDPADPVVMLRLGVEELRDVFRPLGGTRIKFRQRPVRALF